MAPKIKKKVEDYSYEVSRYSPRVKRIFKDSIGGVLDPSAFSSVKGSESLNSPTLASTKTAPVSLRQKTSNPSASIPNSATAVVSVSAPSRSVTLFVIGGITFSEIRSAYEVAESSKREIYIGKQKQPFLFPFIYNLNLLKFYLMG